KRSEVGNGGFATAGLAARLGCLALARRQRSWEDSALPRPARSPRSMPHHCTLHPLPYQADAAAFFHRIHREPGATLLDSNHRPGAGRGRYDILSAWPRETLTPQHQESATDFFARARRSLAGLPRADGPAHTDIPFTGGLLGYLAYDFGQEIGVRPRSQGDRGLPPAKTPTAHASTTARLGLDDWALVSDHQLRTSQLVFHPMCPADTRKRVMRRFTDADAATDAAPSTLPPRTPFTLLTAFMPDIEPADYQRAIARIHDYIRAGDCYQVNYAQRFQARYEGDPWIAYRALRDACPTPFSGYLNLDGDDAVLSLSPERFMRLQDGRIEARPIKGTRPRGATPTQDQALADELLASAKDRAENLMIVDLLRNDIGRVSRIGSVRVPELFSLESYPNVHHLVSSVEAELADGLDAFDLLAASFPGGSITGAPKIRAMEIIDELEVAQRGLYCGSLLYIDSRGNMDSSIAIRSMLA